MRNREDIVVCFAAAVIILLVIGCLILLRTAVSHIDFSWIFGGG